MLWFIRRSCADNENEKIIDGIRSSVCKIYGDPHVKRFGGTFITLLDSGYYKMIKARYFSDSKIKTRYMVSVQSDSKHARILESEKL